jgi:hypothetical protein
MAAHLANEAISLLRSSLSGIFVIVGAFIVVKLNENNKLREEKRANKRLDAAIRVEILAHLRAEAEQVRLMFVTAVVVDNQLEPIHNRLVSKVFSPENAQAFGDDAAALLDTVIACDAAFNFQKLLLSTRPLSATASLAEHEIRQTRGLWTHGRSRSSKSFSTALVIAMNVRSLTTHACNNRLMSRLAFLSRNQEGLPKQSRATEYDPRAGLEVSRFFPPPQKFEGGTRTCVCARGGPV